jgi:hypothetical protein
VLSDKITPDQKLSVHGFLVGVEVEDGIEINSIMKAIGEAMYTFKGIGTVDVEHLGEIETIDDVGIEVPMNPDNLIGMKES